MPSSTTVQELQIVRTPMMATREVVEPVVSSGNFFGEYQEYKDDSSSFSSPATPKIGNGRYWMVGSWATGGARRTGVELSGNEEDDDFEGRVWSSAPYAPKEYFEAEHYDAEYGLWVGSVSCVPCRGGLKKTAVAWKEDYQPVEILLEGVDCYIYMIQAFRAHGLDFVKAMKQDPESCFDQIADLFFDEVRCPERFGGAYTSAFRGTNLGNTEARPSELKFVGARFNLIDGEHPDRQVMNLDRLVEMFSAMATIRCRKNKNGYYDVFMIPSEDENVFLRRYIHAVATWHTKLFGNPNIVPPGAPGYGGVVSRSSSRVKVYEYFN